MHDFIIFPDGTVVFCCMDFSMNYVIGNLLNESYEELLEKQHKLKERLQHDADSMCLKCAFAS